MLELIKKLYEMTKYKGLNEQKKPVLIGYSASNRDQVIDRVTEAGFNQFIESPITAEKFIQIKHTYFDQVLN